jgi:hypothetical protein
MTFGADGEIALYLLKPYTDTTTDTLDMLLGWSVGESVPPETYSVGLHVDSAAGDLVEQDDYGLPGGPFGCRASHIDVSHLPPGEYTLKVVVYDWRTNARLPGRMGDRVADRLPLAAVRVRAAGG